VVETAGARIRTLKQCGTYEDVHSALPFYSQQELQETAIWSTPSKQESSGNWTASIDGASTLALSRA